MCTAQYCVLGVRIGFEETAYSVNEGDGTVRVFVAVLGDNRPSGNVEVTLNTRDGSATSSGLLNQNFPHCC